MINECTTCFRACIALLPVSFTCVHNTLCIVIATSSPFFFQLCESFSSRHRLDLAGKPAALDVHGVFVRMEAEMRSRQQRREDAVVAAAAAAAAAEAEAERLAAEKEAMLKAAADAQAAQEEARRRALALELARCA
jgi:hypothetical protein